MKTLNKDQKMMIYMLIALLIITMLSSCGQKYVAHTVNNNIKTIIYSNDDIYQTNDTVYVHKYAGEKYGEIVDHTIISDKYIIIKKY